MKKYFLLSSRLSACILLNLLPVCGYNQVMPSPFSKAYTGIGAYSRTFITPFSFTSNQAALAQTKEPGGGIYSERPYLLEELTLYSGAAIIPFSSGAVGLSLNRYGNNDYNQLKAGLAYGKKLSNKIDVGIQFNYHRTVISAYGSAAAINVEIGTIIHITDQVHAGIQIANPLNKSGKEQRLAYVNTFGVGYEASEKVFLQMEINKEEKKTLQVNLSLQYNVKEEVFIRTGVLAGNGSLFMGAGLKWKKMRVDVSGSYHAILGISPTVMFIIN